MLFDVLVLLVLAFELLLGFLDGFWVRLLRFLGLVLAIVVSATFTGPLCKVLFAVLPTNSIKSGLLCWLLLLVMVATLAWLLVRWAEHAQDKKKGGGFLSATSHVFGSLIGGLHGILLILLVTWGLGMLRVNFLPRSPSFDSARLMPLVERVNEAAAFASIYPSVEPEALARRVAWQLGHPSRTMELWQDLLQQDAFCALLDSDSFWRSVLEGDEWGILANESFQDLMHDKLAMRSLRILVLPVKDYDQLEEQRVLVDHLAELGRTYNRIREKEKVKALVESLNQDRKFEQGVRAELVTDMRFVRLASKVMREVSPVVGDE
ncbi:CvpA family protein [Verrucomicrobiota bacterium]